MEETELIRRLKARDESAIVVLEQIYERRILKKLVYMLGDVETAKELWIDILLSIWRDIYRFDQNRKENFSTWVYTIAHNRAVDEQRRRKRKYVVESGATSLDEQSNSFTVIPLDKERSSEITSDLSIYHQIISDALNNLSEDDRELLILRGGRHSTSEISEWNHLKPGTVSTRLNRAAERLRQKILTDPRFIQTGLEIPSQGEILKTLKELEVNGDLPLNQNQHNKKPTSPKGDIR